MRHFLARIAACVFLAGCGTSHPASTLASSTPPSENAIRNFHTVHPFLYRSGQPSKTQYSVAAKLGIKTILSLTEYGNQSAADKEKSEAKAAGIKSFIWEPMSPSDQPTMDEINQALGYITDPANQPILVHCTYGSDRTGIVIAAYRIAYDGYSEADAITEMRSLGHISSLYWWDTVLDNVKPAN